MGETRCLVILLTRFIEHGGRKWLTMFFTILKLQLSIISLFVIPFKKIFWSGCSTRMGSTLSSQDTSSYRKQALFNNLVRHLQIPWNLCGKRSGALEVPNKVKNLVWRACKNSLPTKANLVHRKIITDSLCDICKQHQLVWPYWFCFCR